MSRSSQHGSLETNLTRIHQDCYNPDHKLYHLKGPTIHSQGTPLNAEQLIFWGYPINTATLRHRRSYGKAEKQRHIYSQTDMVTNPFFATGWVTLDKLRWLLRVSTATSRKKDLPAESFSRLTRKHIFLSFYFILFIYLFIYLLFRATSSAYGGSQARGLIGAVAADLCHSHRNARSEPRLQHTLQLTATPDP